MPTRPQRQCPACNGALRQIRILEYTSGGEQDLQYALLDAKPSFSGYVDRQGFIWPLLCTSCGLIQLYAVDYREQAEHRKKQEGQVSLAKSDSRGRLSKPKKG